MKIVSGKRMCRILEQRGWTLARINSPYLPPYRQWTTNRRSRAWQSRSSYEPEA